MESDRSAAAKQGVSRCIHRGPRSIYHRHPRRHVSRRNILASPLRPRCLRSLPVTSLTTCLGICSAAAVTERSNLPEGRQYGWRRNARVLVIAARLPEQGPGAAEKASIGAVTCVHSHATAHDQPGRTWTHRPVNPSTWVRTVVIVRIPNQPGWGLDGLEDVSTWVGVR